MNRYHRTRGIAALALLTFASQAMAQKGSHPENALVNVLFKCCVKSKFPHVEHTVSKPLSAFDPDSGHNFVYDKTIPAWIDTKTGNPLCSGALVNVLFECCVKSKFPHVEHTVSKPLSAFDPDSGHNFVYDKSIPAWIDTKTGECCPECKPKRTAQPSPTPSTTSKVTDVLKTIGSSVSIGIGGGSTLGHGGHKGDRHLTDQKRTSNQTNTTKIKKQTSKTKQLPAGCKCHPCTCSPCTCH
jgi:hypothetical protein